MSQRWLTARSVDVDTTAIETITPHDGFTVGTVGTGPGKGSGPRDNGAAGPRAW